MNANDAEQMLKVLHEANKNKTGSDLLTQGAPSPNEIWATIVAISDRVEALAKEIKPTN